MADYCTATSRRDESAISQYDIDIRRDHCSIARRAVADRPGDGSALPARPSITHYAGFRCRELISAYVSTLPATQGSLFGGVLADDISPLDIAL